MLEGCKGVFEKIGLSVAGQLCDTCCFLFCYQPKEPSGLKKLKKNDHNHKKDAEKNL